MKLLLLIKLIYIFRKNIAKEVGTNDFHNRRIKSIVKNAPTQMGEEHLF